MLKTEGVRNRYVYGHYTLDTNELFYIGVGVGYRAWSLFGRNDLWKNIEKKHGRRVEILVDGFTDRDLAVKKEIELQQLHIPRACFVYGDQHAAIVSKETRAKLSKANTGKKHSEATKRKLSEMNMGKKRSEEIKRKISQSTKGKTFSSETLRKLSDARKGTGVRSVIRDDGVVFPSVKEAAAKTGVDATGIVRSAKGQRKTCGGYVWKYLESKNNV